MCEELGIECFRGSLDHVLDRFYQAARQFNAKTVMRLTGDCPLTDPEKLDDLVDFFESKDVDYASNCIPPTLPDGLDAEIFTMAALENAWKNAVLPSETEHVTPYLRDEKNGFITACKTYEPSTAGLRWCVDNPEDFEFAKSVYEHLYPSNPQFTTDDILDLLKRKPSLSTINSHIDRNEGALKALKLDKKFLKNK